MKYLLKYNIVHIIVLLTFNFIGLYGMPILFKDHLTCFIATPIYFSIVNLFIIFWVCKFGLPADYSLWNKARLPSGGTDFIMILIIFFSSFIIPLVIEYAQRFHVFDFLSTNLQRRVAPPNIATAKEYRIIVTIVLLLSTIILVISEELFFRAYLFERQFYYLGRLTWLLNGFFWTIYHVFSDSNLIEMLIVAFIYSLVYQQKRNIIITFIPHIMINIIGISNLIFVLF